MILLVLVCRERLAWPGLCPAAPTVRGQSVPTVSPPSLSPSPGDWLGLSRLARTALPELHLSRVDIGQSGSLGIYRNIFRVES